jgi:Lrp/AsnC family leucine-responsive transcriptional regulator
LTQNNVAASEARSERGRRFGELHKPFYSLDEVDLRIIGEIRTNGPRNITAIAQALNVAPSTVLRRIDNLTMNLRLSIMTNLAYHKMGVKRAFLRIAPSREDDREVMDNIFSLGYWFQSYRVLGGNGHLVGFKIPDQLHSHYKAVLTGLSNLYSITELSFHTVGEIAGLGPSFRWYDPEKKRWSIQWNEIREKLVRSDPLLLNDSEDYSSHVDQLDIIILLAMEGNARTSFSEIARVAGVSIPTVSDRLKKLTERGLILGYACNLLPFAPEESRLLELIVSFPGKDEMSRFASGLLETPFLLSFSKEVGKDVLFIRSYLPNNDFRSLSVLLSDLMKEGAITDFKIIELDVDGERLSQISPTLFGQDLRRNNAAKSDQEH